MDALLRGAVRASRSRRREPGGQARRRAAVETHCAGRYTVSRRRPQNHPTRAIPIAPVNTVPGSVPWHAAQVSTPVTGLRGRPPADSPAGEPRGGIARRIGALTDAVGRSLLVGSVRAAVVYGVCPDRCGALTGSGAIRRQRRARGWRSVSTRRAVRVECPLLSRRAVRARTGAVPSGRQTKRCIGWCCRCLEHVPTERSRTIAHRRNQAFRKRIGPPRKWFRR